MFFNLSPCWKSSLFVAKSPCHSLAGGSTEEWIHIPVQKGCSVRGLRELRLQGLGVVRACVFNAKIAFLLRNSNSATTSRKPLPF